MIYIRQCQLILVIFIVITDKSFALLRNTNLENVIHLYNETYEARQLRRDPFCDSDFEIKTTICNIIFEHPYYKTEIKIYLNKMAIFYQWISCENNIIILHEESEGTNDKMQRMFPCYGRHDPLQTGWGIDSFYRHIFLSDGPQDNSVFVYYLSHEADEDLFYLNEIISEIDVTNLIPTVITYEDLRDERKSVQSLSINREVFLMEVAYIQNIIRKQFTPKYSICNLSKQQKLATCKMVVQTIEKKVEDFKFKLLESLFGLLSLDCVEKSIEFSYHESAEVSNVRRRMFTCYGYFVDYKNYITRLQLSDGYYENSIIVFMLLSYKNFTHIYTFHSYLENINVSKIKPVLIPPFSP